MRIYAKLSMIVAAIVLSPGLAQARDAGQIADWYVKDLQTTITVNADSSLLVEEKIIADCGNLPGKHGIFRVLPTQAKTETKTIKTPVNLISITDFNGQPVNYSESQDNFNHTLTWKIGDADKTVTGENDYKITYLVKNAVRSQNADFDELYLNILGNFWDIQIDNFGIDIIFPQGIDKNNAQVYLYSGDTGQKTNDLANYEWAGNNILHIASTKTIPTRQGITASIAFPKGIITPYQPSFFDIYGGYLWFLIPLAVFIFTFVIWRKYGKDPKVDKTIIPEFEIPENLSPLEMGMLANNGNLDNKLITAAIIGLAVKKHLVIEEIPKSGFFGKQDFFLQKTEALAPALGAPEILVMEKIFTSGKKIKLSSLNDKFYADLPKIKKMMIESLKEKGLIFKSGLTAQAWFFGLFFASLILVFAAIGTGSMAFIGAAAISAAIILVFALLMPKRTPKGAELNWRIKGFKLYMETAEKYRSRFNEKENIFEKFLPYAIMFGIAKLWAKKMEDIYGKEYFANYHPAWYAGSFAGGFDADNFAARVGSISAGIAANMGTSSGAHGSGGAGGGGGGGGGGGW